MQTQRMILDGRVRTALLLTPALALALAGAGAGVTGASTAHASGKKSDDAGSTHRPAGTGTGRRIR